MGTNTPGLQFVHTYIRHGEGTGEGRGRLWLLFLVLRVTRMVEKLSDQGRRKGAWLGWVYCSVFIYQYFAFLVCLQEQEHSKADHGPELKERSEANALFSILTCYSRRDWLLSWIPRVGRLKAPIHANGCDLRYCKAAWDPMMKLHSREARISKMKMLIAA